MRNLFFALVAVLAWDCAFGATHTLVGKGHGQRFPTNDWPEVKAQIAAKGETLVPGDTIEFYDDYVIRLTGEDTDAADYMFKVTQHTSVGAGQLILDGCAWTDVIPFCHGTAGLGVVTTGEVDFVSTSILAPIRALSLNNTDVGFDAGSFLHVTNLTFNGYGTFRQDGGVVRAWADSPDGGKNYTTPLNVGGTWILRDGLVDASREVFNAGNRDSLALTGRFYQYGGIVSNCEMSIGTSALYCQYGGTNVLWRNGVGQLSYNGNGGGHYRLDGGYLELGGNTLTVSAAAASTDEETWATLTLGPTGTLSRSDLIVYTGTTQKRCGRLIVDGGTYTVSSLMLSSYGNNDGRNGQTGVVQVVRGGDLTVSTTLAAASATTHTNGYARVDVDSDGVLRVKRSTTWYGLDNPSGMHSPARINVTDGGSLFFSANPTEADWATATGGNVDLTMKENAALAVRGSSSLYVKRNLSLVNDAAVTFDCSLIRLGGALLPTASADGLRRPSVTVKGTGDVEIESIGTNALAAGTSYSLAFMLDKTPGNLAPMKWTSQSWKSMPLSGDLSVGLDGGVALVSSNSFPLIRTVNAGPSAYICPGTSFSSLPDASLWEVDTPGAQTKEIAAHLKASAARPAGETFAASATGYAELGSVSASVGVKRARVTLTIAPIGDETAESVAAYIAAAGYTGTVASGLDKVVVEIPPSSVVCGSELRFVWDLTGRATVSKVESEFKPLHPGLILLLR